MSEPRIWRMYAGRDDRLGFRNFGARQYVEMYGHTEVVPVELTEDPNGPFYGWLGFATEWRKADEEPCMVQGHRGIFDMQFPYGPDAEVERGRGEIVRLTAHEVNP